MKLTIKKTNLKSLLGKEIATAQTKDVAGARGTDTLTGRMACNPAPTGKYYCKVP
ncbi:MULTISPECIES: hypothetical protein [Pseudoalteromonas]|uniref:hypothetical protein n=1 Tax=Pseudoalteromonas TaxID=53246 RepID=UPI0013EEE39D|nr:MULTISPECIES: hypothetical protein [Pseudoalteromonas]MDP4487973.1 hypothetical protein [Pseudoalteromonas piscicida]|tara:strand:+ start:389 stop:553 length:165 start_codon:yes stop_codon:yes gene_type:complete